MILTMSKNRKLLVGTIALVLVIALFGGTGAVVAHEDEETSDGETSDYCHGDYENDHEDHHENYEDHHGGNHHHEDGSSSWGFIEMIRELFS